MSVYFTIERRHWLTLTNVGEHCLSKRHALSTVAHQQVIVWSNIQREHVIKLIFGLIVSLRKSHEAKATKWGWLLKEDGPLYPNRTTLPKASKACRELKKCTCREGCGEKCGCKKSGLSCTERCPCNGYCE